MKRAVIRQILWITAVALALYAVSSVITVALVGRKSAEDNALSQLRIFERNILDSGLSTKEDFIKLTNMTDGSLRITVIALDGTVYADTARDELENHKDRPEFIAAINGEIGRAVRLSGSTGAEYLYLAKRVDSVVLRVAVPIQNINIYIWPMIGVMALLFGLVLTAVFFAAPALVGSMTAPITTIKEKLDTVGKPAERKITLTPYDEVNRVLLEIDEIASTLDASFAETRAEKENLSAILENISFSVIALDSELKIILSNHAAKLSFGYDVDGCDLYTAVHGAQFLKRVDNAMRLGVPEVFDREYPNGEIYEIRLLPAGASDIKLIITAQNVTGIRKLSREKQDFFVNASHELNTPLSSVLGYAEILKREKTYKAEFVDTIYKQALRMKRLLDDMLILSGLQEGVERGEESVDLKEIAADVMAAYKPKADEKNIRLTESTEQVFVTANKERMTALLSNLVDNAIKYTNTGGFVLLNLRNINGKAVVTVKDNGIGIAAQHLPRIFERFYRTDEGRARKEGGTGLGLAIVKHICNRYGAVISVESTEGVGTEFTINF